MNDREWQTDKKWADRFLPEIKRALGEHLIAAAPLEEDAEHNTDLIVLRLEAVRIACRVRKFKYYANPKYRPQFTIRTERPTGAKTELAKIIEGWGDYFFYGFCDESEQNLIAWRLIKLGAFRLWVSTFMATHHGALPGSPQENGDKTKFRAFNFTDLPVGALVAEEPNF